jgi:hypothetical protein
MFWWPPSLSLEVDYLDVEPTWVVWQYKKMYLPLFTPERIDKA